MQENVQKEESGVSLLEILRLLLSKIKLLILVVIIAGIAGGGFALYTSWNNLYYGTQVEFYVNPEKPKNTTSDGASQYGVYGAYGRHVMDNMVKLLESESFTEQLLLNGETLPQIDFNAGDTTPMGITLVGTQYWSWIERPDVEDAKHPHYILKAAIADAKKARAIANAQITELESKTLLKTEQMQAYNNLSLEMSNAWLKLYLNKVVKNPSFLKLEYEKLIKDSGPNPTNEITELIKLYDAIENTKLAIDTAQQAIDQITPAFTAADEAEEAALNLWRESAGYKALLGRYSAAVNYSYLSANADIEDANNLARSFIYVNISVVGEQNQDFAKEVLNRVKVLVPKYVEANMTVPADYQGTNCQRITRTDEIRRTNPNSRTTQAIKYGLLFAAAALVVAAVVVIIIDKSDKRLRDTEIITKKFNVPVLGVVPSIEELNEESHAKKLASKTAIKEAK